MAGSFRACTWEWVVERKVLGWSEGGTAEGRVRHTRFGYHLQGPKVCGSRKPTTSKNQGCILRDHGEQLRGQETRALVTSPWVHVGTYVYVCNLTMFVTLLFSREWL